MVSVADTTCEHDRRERHRHPVRAGHRPHRVAQHEVRVRECDAGSVRDRELELTGRVLRVELHHARPLGLERPDQVAGERLLVGEHRSAVSGSRVRGDRVVLVRFVGPVPPSEEELELVGAAELEARVAQPLEHPASERASARRPGVPLLIPLIDRRHGPARRRGEGDRRGRVGDQARVAGRPVDAGDRGVAVVHEEHREHRGQAHPGPRDLLEASQRNDLDPRDAVRTHDGQGNRLDPRRREPPGHRRRRRRGRRPRSCGRRLAGSR